MRSRLHCVHVALRYEAIRISTAPMNELQFGNQVRQALNEGRALRPGTLARLRAARMAALERHPPAPVPVAALADNVVGRADGTPRLSRILLVPMLLLVLGLAFLYAAQQNRRAAETIEVDTQLLADELPIDAYLDKGFEAWLRKRRAR